MRLMHALRLLLEAYPEGKAVKVDGMGLPKDIAERESASDAVKALLR